MNSKIWEVRQVEEVAVWDEEGGVTRRLVEDGFRRGRAASTTF